MISASYAEKFSADVLSNYNGMPKEEERVTNKTHAVGQMQGYMLQVRHMLFELISLDDIVVSVEKLDDVAVEFSDGSVIAEQLKSVTSDGNPATNRSIALWKTLYNWFDYVRSGSLVLNETIFRMVVVSNHEFEVGDIASQFHGASTKEEAQKALRAARLNIWGKDDVLRNKIPSSYGQYLEVLFSSDNEELVSQIISKITLDIHEIDYDEKLIKKFNGQPIPTEFADILFEYMLGWVTNRANEYIKQGLPAIIRSIDFRKALVEQNRMYNQRESIPALSQEVTSKDVITEVGNQDIYIQQLELIEMDFDDKLEAAGDYLRTKAETTIRADKGLFPPQGLTDYNDRIYRLWKSKRMQILLAASDSDIIKGKQLYAQASEAVTFSDNVYPSFFGSGTLQTLANKPCEEPKIGWHPDYKKLLKGDV